MNTLGWIFLGLAVIAGGAAIYFYARRSTSKGRFALAIVSALVSIFAITFTGMSNINLVSVALVLVRGGTPSEAFAAGDPAWW